MERVQITNFEQMCRYGLATIHHRVCEFWKTHILHDKELIHLLVKTATNFTYVVEQESQVRQSFAQRHSPVPKTPTT